MDIIYIQKNIVDVLKYWRERTFDIGNNFRLFLYEHIKINLIEQLIPNSINTYTELQTKFEQTLSHLNCEDYKHVYKKFEEIEQL